MGQPIQCWFPAYYRGNCNAYFQPHKTLSHSGWWQEYALDYCYVQNTYFLGFTEVKPDNYFDIAKHVIPIPKEYAERDEKQLGMFVLQTCLTIRTCDFTWTKFDLPICLRILASLKIFSLLMGGGIKRANVPI